MFYDLLIRAPEGGHVVHFFDNEKALFQAASIFALVGLRQGEGVILIADPSKMELLQQHHTFEPSDQLMVLNARDLLSRFYVDGVLNERGFASAIMEPVRRLRDRYTKVRIWGGLLNLLWENGERNAAFAVEGLWNRIAVLEPFFLLHTYVLDPARDPVSAQKLSGQHTFSSSGQRL